MNLRAVEALEGWLRLRNRLVGVGEHADAMRHFGPGGVEEAEALCAEANLDLLGFLRPPAALEPARVEGAPARPLSPRHLGTVYRFDSPIPSGHPGNDRVELRVLRPRRRSHERRVVMFHHPLYQKRWPVWEWFLADVLERFPVAMMAGPYHFRRRLPDQFAGEGAVNPNPWRLFESIRQWCWDQKAASALLRETCGLTPVAVMGFSLGAFQSLLVAATGDHTLPIVSIACTNRYAFGVHEGVIARGLRDGFERAGIDRARLERMTESLQLERWAPRVHQPVLYVAGRWDRVDPPPSGERLEAAIRRRRSMLVDAGHATVVLERRSVAPAILEFLDEASVS